MPELPEVETIKKQLQPFLPGVVTKTYRSQFFKQNIYLSPKRFPKLDEILSVERFGKFLYFKTPTHMMYSHLGMSGAWIIQKDILAPKLKHTHLSLTIEKEDHSSVRLDYVDPRRFGKIKILDHEEHEDKLKRLFPDPSTELFTLKTLTEALNKFPNRKLKVTLLDQELFPGVGNYMASEICAHAKVLPDRFVTTLKAKDIKNLFKAFDIVLNGSIASNGTTFSGGYKDAYGEKGEGVQNLVVFYQKICQMCGQEEVIKTYLAQRGTYHCPRCQK